MVGLAHTRTTRQVGSVALAWRGAVLCDTSLVGLICILLKCQELHFFVNVCSLKQVRDVVVFKLPVLSADTCGGIRYVVVPRVTDGIRSSRTNGPLIPSHRTKTIATFRVARLTLQTRKLWCRDRHARMLRIDK